MHNLNCVAYLVGQVESEGDFKLKESKKGEGRCVRVGVCVFAIYMCNWFA